MLASWMDGQDPIGSLINGSPIPPQKVSQLSSPLASQLSMSIVHHSMYITCVCTCKILSKNATLRHIDNAQIWVYTLDIYWVDFKTDPVHLISYSTLSKSFFD